MTALADALQAAQRAALHAIGKAYVILPPQAEDKASTLAKLHEIGCTDVVEGAQLLAAWDVLRELGAAAPQPNGAQSYEERRKSEPATQLQKDAINKRLSARDLAPFEPDDFAGITKAQASEMISALDAGTYDDNRWRVRF